MTETTKGYERKEKIWFECDYCDNIFYVEKNCVTHVKRRHGKNA